MSTTQYVDVQRTLENVENELHPENSEAVRDFINHNAAEGISDIQQQRHAYALKTLLKKFAPSDFRLRGATKDELKTIMAKMNRIDYADATKHKFKAALKKFYRVGNDGEHPDKVDFFRVSKKKATPVTRNDLFTDDELKQLFCSFASTRDRAFTMVLYESAARPGELLSRSIADFTSNGKGDFIYLEGSKGTTDRTNQLVRAGRTLREWLAQHPLGGQMGDIDDSTAPLWVKTEQQQCINCGKVPQFHDDGCDYDPDLADRLSYGAFRRRFKKACEKADIPENKQRPYNLRHTRLTEVATFMGYERLNKFAGWVPGSNRAKVYVHLNNDDVNQAIRDEYGLESTEDEQKTIECPFCGAENQSEHAECRTCGRPLSLKQESNREEKLNVIERLEELEENGLLEKLDQLAVGGEDDLE